MLRICYTEFSFHCNLVNELWSLLTFQDKRNTCMNHIRQQTTVIIASGLSCDDTAHSYMFALELIWFNRNCFPTRSSSNTDNIVQAVSIMIIFNNNSYIILIISKNLCGYCFISSSYSYSLIYGNFSWCSCCCPLPLWLFENWLFVHVKTELKIQYS